MAAGRLVHTLVVRHPDTLVATPLLAGSPVPEWAADLVHDDDVEGAAKPEDYGAWTVAALEPEVASRNTDREDDDKVVPASGKKADLVAALVADDEHADNG